MAATVTSFWGLGVIIGVAVLLIGMTVTGASARRRRRRRQQVQLSPSQEHLVQQAIAPLEPIPSAQAVRPEAYAAEAAGTDSVPIDHASPADSSDAAEHSAEDAAEQSAGYADPAHTTEAAPTEPGDAADQAVAASEGAAARIRRVTVRVQTIDDEPVDHAVLTLAGLEGRQIASAESGNDGLYDLGPVDAGSYVLIVRCPEYRPYADVVELGEGLPSRTRVELRSDSGLTGVVRRKDGEPVSGATVTMKDDHGVVMTARTGPDGEYRVAGVQPGPYTLMVTARVCRPVELAVDVPEHGLSRQDVELIGGAHVQGTVRVDQGRKVLPGTRILLLDERGEVLATTDADEQGRYRFSEVNAGEYTVCATPPSPAVSTVRIDGGLVHELDLELRQTS